MNMERENLKKENLLLRIFKGIKKGWERLGQEDIVAEDSFIRDRDRNIKAQVARLEEIQAEVHNQKGFITRAKVNENIANETAKGKGRKISEKVLGDI